MQIKRLQLDMEFDNESLQAFHTDFDPGNECSTIVCVNGQEFEGRVSFKQEGDTYELIITKERTN